MSGLGAAILGLCAAGWLALAPVAFGYRDASPQAALHRAALHQAALHRAALADWITAAVLAAVSLVTLLAWIVAWRRRLRADGVVAGTSRRQAWREARALRRRARDEEHARDEGQAPDVAGPAAEPPDPTRVLSDLRALLVPLLADQEAGQPDPGRDEPAADEAGREPVHHEPVHHEPVHHEPVHHEPAAGQLAAAEPARAAPAAPVPLPRPGGLAAMESMLAGAELLMVACGEEETW